MREEKAKALQYYVQLGLAISIFVTFLGGAYNYFQTTAAENVHYIIVIGIISYVIIATISYVIIIKLFYLFKWHQFEKIAFFMPFFLFIYMSLRQNGCNSFKMLISTYEGSVFLKFPSKGSD